MKVSYIVILLSLLALNLNAQTSFEEFKKRRNAEFAKYKERVKTEFEEFRERRNAEFAKLISRRWDMMKHYKGVEPPTKPEPVKPVIKDNNEPVVPPVKIPVDKVVSIPKPDPRVPLNIVPIPNDINQRNYFTKTFYGTPVMICFENGKHKFKLANINESEVGKAWQTMSDGRMDDVVDMFLSWRKKISVNDYAYILMVEDLCNAFWGNTSANESVVMQTYILTQCGYDVKIARKNTSLLLLVAVEETVYRKTFLTIGGKKYYVLSDTKEKGDYYTFNEDFAGKMQKCSMQITEPIMLAESRKAQGRLFSSEKYPQLSVNITVNSNLIKLYNDYPILDWELYANTPMSNDLANKLLPALKKEVAGKTEEQAANIILNFVQTAFQYKTDEEQFGYERPFFVDELFYYDYSDCEDRAVLFSYLVRKILQLDVVLLYYPNHLATAVKFSTYSDGDYVSVNGKKYVVCDPTYINANIGEAMPKFKNVSAKVIEL